MRAHGVEFFHADFGKSPMAFLEGYEWKKNPERKMTVETLSNNSKIFASGSINPFHILEDIKETVQYFLPTPNAQTENIHGGKVKAWFNG